MSVRQRRAESFVAIGLRAAERDAVERAAAEAYAAGALGLSEDEGLEGVGFTVYAPAARAERVRAALAVPGVEVLPALPLPDVDWSERWKRDLSAVVVSPRLMVRPSFDATPAVAGQCELVIDPGQAFGTGGHASTRLALECLDAIAGELSPATRALDVGTGSGVLALAALGLGCGRVCGLDLDPLAAEAARDNAARNGFRTGLDLFVGAPAALAPGVRFDLVLANLLFSELSPLLPALAGHTRDGARWIVSGLLETQRAALERAAAGCGLVTEGSRRRLDDDGVAWIALLMRRAPARPSPAADAPG